MPARSPVRYRSLRVADFDEIYALWKRTEGIGLGESDSRDAVGRFLRRNPGLSLVATSDRKVIATLLCGHDGRRGYLHHLAVARRWRRRGVGRVLVAASMEKLQAEGIAKCNLFLFASNKTGRAFWHHMGWDVRDDLRLVQRGTAPACGACRASC
jgi:ribosomal protein S18 acetylase RimI-like enzyme